MENYITTIEKNGKKYAIGGEYCFINLEEIATVGDLMDQIPDCTRDVKYPFFGAIPSENAILIGVFSFTVITGEDDFYNVEIEQFDFDPLGFSEWSTVARGSEHTLQDLRSLEVGSLTRYPIRMVPPTNNLDYRKTYKLNWHGGGLCWVEE